LKFAICNPEGHVRSLTRAPLGLFFPGASPSLERKIDSESLELSVKPRISSIDCLSPYLSYGRVLMLPEASS